MPETTQIYIHGLRGNTEEEVADVVKKFGRIGSINCFGTFAFVEFYNRDDAMDCIDKVHNSRIGDAKVSLSLSKSSGAPNRNNYNSYRNRNAVTTEEEEDEEEEEVRYEAPPPPPGTKIVKKRSDLFGLLTQKNKRVRQPEDKGAQPRSTISVLTRTLEENASSGGVGARRAPSPQPGRRRSPSPPQRGGAIRVEKRPLSPQRRRRSRSRDRGEEDKRRRRSRSRSRSPRRR